MLKAWLNLESLKLIYLTKSLWNSLIGSEIMKFVRKSITVFTIQSVFNNLVDETSFWATELVYDACRLRENTFNALNRLKKGKIFLN